MTPDLAGFIQAFLIVVGSIAYFVAILRKERATPVEAPAPDPEAEFERSLSLLYGPLGKCTCSQRGEPVPIIVHDTLDGSEYVIRVVCSICWQTATNNTPRPDWRHDVYPRPVPWQDTLPPEDAPLARVDALRDLLHEKGCELDTLVANLTTHPVYGIVDVSAEDHDTVNELRVDMLAIRAAIDGEERAERATLGLCVECGRSLDDGHAHVDAITGERADAVQAAFVTNNAQPGGLTPQQWAVNAKAFGFAAEALRVYLCDDPDFETITNSGGTVLRSHCSHCGRTPFEHGEVTPIHDPETGEHLGSVQRGDDGEAHLVRGDS